MSFLALIKAQFQQKARCKENVRFLCTLIQGNPKDLIAICSQDGIPPERQDWANAAPILCVPALPSGEIANTEGVSHFTLVWDEKHISVEFDDWDLMTVQRFTPT